LPSLDLPLDHLCENLTVYVIENLRSHIQLQHELPAIRDINKYCRQFLKSLGSKPALVDGCFLLAAGRQVLDLNQDSNLLSENDGVTSKFS
jgi:hypothetical protein